MKKIKTSMTTHSSKWDEWTTSLAKRNPSINIVTIKQDENMNTIMKSQGLLTDWHNLPLPIEMNGGGDIVRD